MGQALCTLSGHLVGRPRPSTQLIELRIDPQEIEGFPCFPSGHTVHYTVFFGFLGFLAFTRVKPVPLRAGPLLGVLGGLVLLRGPALAPTLGANWHERRTGGIPAGWCRAGDRCPSLPSFGPIVATTGNSAPLVVRRSHLCEGVTAILPGPAYSPLRVLWHAMSDRRCSFTPPRRRCSTAAAT